MPGAHRRFRFVEEIAEGGFGKVFLAEQESADGFSRLVAIKLLHTKWTANQEVLSRTRDEARLLGLIHHESIVRVEDLTSIDGKVAIIMEYLEGVDLRWMIQFLGHRRTIFPRKALFEIMAKVVEALDAAYNSIPRQGEGALQVIHRDIKPSNVFVTVAGGVKVLDFGTARANFSKREAVTRILAFGSQGFMAPERLRGGKDSPAGDVFSLGVTLWELLALVAFGKISGRRERLNQHVTSQVDGLLLRGEPGWADRVRDTLKGMLAFEPEDRPTPAELVDTLAALAEDAPGMPLRQFSRSLVAEARELLPKAEEIDPLIGRTLEEDGTPATPPPEPPEFTGTITKTIDPVRAAAAATLAPEPSVSPLARKADAAPAAIPPRGGTSVRTLIVVALLGALMVLGVAVVSAAVAGLSVATFLRTESAGPEPSTEVPPTSGRVIAPGSATTPRVETILEFAGPSGGLVRISGPGGFAAEWGGESAFDLGRIHSGAYEATFKPPGGGESVNAAFEVLAGTARCRFTFNIGEARWSGSCT